MKTHFASVVTLVFLFCRCAIAFSADPSPEWIWASDKRQPDVAICLKTGFTVGNELRRAQAVLVAEYCHSTVWVNGKRIAAQEPFGPAMKLDLTEALREGENTLGLCCRSVPGPAAVM